MGLFLSQNWPVGDLTPKHTEKQPENQTQKRQICVVGIDNTTKMSYIPPGAKTRDPLMIAEQGTAMTRFERLLTLSATTCCVCDHPVSLQELNEFYGITDEQLHSEVHCRSCMETCLVLCRECSSRYTAAGLCEECAAQDCRKMEV
jgi:hypothetical protein